MSGIPKKYSSLEIYTEEMKDPARWKKFLKRVEKRARDARKQQEHLEKMRGKGEPENGILHETRQQFLQMYQAILRENGGADRMENAYHDLYSQIPHWPYGPYGGPEAPSEGEEEAQLPLDFDESED